MPETHDVVVIGAGMAGVTAGRALARGGLDVVLVEAGDRVGGRICTVRDLVGRPVEAGAELIHGSKAATWSDVRAGGLETVPVPYLWSWFNLAGTTRWLPRHLVHPGVWRAFDILRSLERLEGADSSAASFIKRKGYQGRARELAQLALTAHLPGGVDEVGIAGLAADGVLRLERGVNHRVVSGYDLLPQQIATGLDVRFGFRVHSIDYGPHGVTVSPVNGDPLVGRTSITTLPHGVLARDVVIFDPPLPAAKQAAIERISTGAVAKVLIAFDRRFWHRRTTQVVCGTGPVTLYWPTSVGTDGPPVLSAYATGPRAQVLSDAGADRALEIVLDDLERVFPGAAPRDAVLGARFVDWTSDPNAYGGFTFLPPGAVGARDDLAAPTPPLFWAGSATEPHPVADTIEAAYLSGLRAARQVSAHLRKPSPSGETPSARLNGARGRRRRGGPGRS